jgi:hypothetical protein
MTYPNPILNINAGLTHLPLHCYNNTFKHQYLQAIPVNAVWSKKKFVTFIGGKYPR